MLSKSLGALAIVLGLGLVGAAYYSGIGQHGSCGGCPLSRGAATVSDCCSGSDVEEVAGTCSQAASDCCQLKTAVKAPSCCDEKGTATVVTADKAPAAPAAALTAAPAAEEKAP